MFTIDPNAYSLMSPMNQPHASDASRLQQSNDEHSKLHRATVSTMHSKLKEEEERLPLKTLNKTSSVSDAPSGYSTNENVWAEQHRGASRDIHSRSLRQRDIDIDPQAEALSQSRSPSPPQIPPADQNATKIHIRSSEEYMDPTSKTPRLSQSPARSLADETSDFFSLADAMISDQSESHEGDGEGDEDYNSKDKAKDYVAGNGEKDSESEIQSIIDQFENAEGIPDEEEVMSPRLQITSPKLQNPIYYPPRKSSLELIRPVQAISLPSPELAIPVSSSTIEMAQREEHPITKIQRTPSVPCVDSSETTDFNPNDLRNQTSPQSSISLHKVPPPEPDPEPVLPFDFHRFLEQLRHRTADPVAKFLRSFLVEFGKKQWMVHEQVKIISDFLAFITNKMVQCDVWRGVSDVEFDNAKEGMEKLVMNRLYSQTFSPAIPPTPPAQDFKGKRKTSEKVLAQARKGQHQEDIERDEILGQKIQIYGWVEEIHLDIPPVEESGRRFLSLAQQGTCIS